MSPQDVRLMSWFFFLSLLDYKNDEIEKENKLMDEQMRQVKRGR